MFTDGTAAHSCRSKTHYRLLDTRAVLNNYQGLRFEGLDFRHADSSFPIHCESPAPVRLARAFSSGEALRRHIEADPALKVNATHGRSTAAKKMMFSTVIQFSLGIFGDAVLLKAGGGGGDRAEPRGRRRKGHAIDVQALLWACVGRLAGEQYEMLIVPGTAALCSTRGRNSRLRRIPHGNRCNNIGAPS